MEQEAVRSVVDSARTMRIPTGYSVEIDTVDKSTWHGLLQLFDDANIYQTWSYEAERSGERQISHLLLKKDGNVVAAAQARITKIPFINVGAAYVRWGPMWCLHGRPRDHEILALAVRCLRNEYVCQRRLPLRLLPRVLNDKRDIVEPILIGEKFHPVPDEGAQRTLLVDLEPTLGELRKGLDQKWRNCLNRAEKNNLTIEDGTHDDLFRVFLDIYAQMHARKQFVETSDINQFRAIQGNLPDQLKMRIAIAFSNRRPAAGVVCSKIGDMGIYLFGGTSDVGLNTNASYLLQWHMLTWLKSDGATSYNLHGINPEKNPGTYRFKAGFCGKNGKDLSYLGVYDSADVGAAQALFRFATSARLIYRRGRTAIPRFRQRKT
jgi:lipid II:glycine glycyltransferase (peptidoglycan interpeptide bridge formation enzyme)